jgi:hypothetical protein
MAAKHSEFQGFSTEMVNLNGDILDEVHHQWENDWQKCLLMGGCKVYMYEI